MADTDTLVNDLAKQSRTVRAAEQRQIGRASCRERV